jgi:hypothetical protein
MSETTDSQKHRDAWNAARFLPGETGGLYESYFLRANHPEKPLAFWLRYTVFCPRGRPQDAQGELWAIWFDGEAQRIVAVKESRPIAECRFSTERLDARIGPLWSPRLTLLVLRDAGEEIALNGLWQATKAQGHYDFFTWTLDSHGPQGRLHGRIEAPASAFVGLNYLNPPGGAKTCFNTKLAAAEFILERPGRPAKTFVTRSRAAFEILTDRGDHGVPVVA